MRYDIKNIKLADDGLKKINWAKMDMPVLSGIALDFKKRKLLKSMIFFISVYFIIYIFTLNIL